MAVVYPMVDKYRVPVGAEGFGRFCPESRPLVAIYELVRHQDGELRIEEVEGVERIMTLVRHCFSG